MSARNHPKILMLGTDVSTKGGIATVVKDYIDCGLMSRLNIQYVATHRDGSRATKVLFFFKQFPKIVLKVIPAKIVHLHTSHGWSYRRLASILFIANLLGKKTVLHVHGSQFDIYFEQAGRVERAIIQYGLRVASIVIALSQDWKLKLLEIESAAKVFVVRNGVDTAKYQQVAERALHDPVSILFLGRLGDRKGIYDLLDVIQKVSSSRFRFVLAGDGDIERVRSLVLERGLENYVHVPGWVGPEEKGKLLRDADLYVLPSYHEGLPISILEAMAAALPVVSTPVGGVPEAVIDGCTGYLVPPGDSHALRKGIERATADPVMWRKMSDASMALARSAFSMEVVEHELYKIYGLLTS